MAYSVGRGRSVFMASYNQLVFPFTAPQLSPLMCCVRITDPGAFMQLFVGFDSHIGLVWQLETFVSSVAEETET